MQRRSHVYIFSTLLFLTYSLLLILVATTPALAVDCPNGYEYRPASGIDCVQINCNKVPDAHIGSTGYCVCGSSGSIHEDPVNDPNQECEMPKEHAACPGCVFSCVMLDADCPDTKKVAEEQNRCLNMCKDLLRGGSDQSEILVASGRYPDCNCTVDVKDDHGRIKETRSLKAGDKRVTLVFDPETGKLLRKEEFSMSEKREEIRESLGFRYSEEEIDKMIDDRVISKWFTDKMSNIKTVTTPFSFSFWWQRSLAILDHGFNSSSDFVDTYHFGRCGDSMLWLEKNLSSELNLGDKKHEAFLSITGENYWNLTNHTAIFVRPQGVTNSDWAEAVNKMIDGSRTGNGLSRSQIDNIDSKILKAKVIDPYFKTETTVEKFIEGWSVIRIS